MVIRKKLMSVAVLAAICGGAHAASTIDMVVAMDESGSMSGEHNAFIGSYIQNLDNILNTQHVTVNRYGLTGFGGSTGQSVSANEAGRDGNAGSVLYRHFNMTTSPASLLGTSAQFGAVTPQLTTSGGTEDGYRMMDYILRNYTFRNNAGASILLISDEDRDIHSTGAVLTGLPQGATIYNSDVAANRQTMLTLLNQKRVVLNAVVNQRLTDRSATPRTAIAIVGADPLTGYAYVRDNNLIVKVQGYTLGSDSGTTDQDYTALALATGGTVADIDQLRSVYQDVTALQSLTGELAEVVAAISQNQQAVVGVDCNAATGAVKTLCRALISGNSAVQSQIGNHVTSPAQVQRLVPRDLQSSTIEIVKGARSHNRIISGRIGETHGDRGGRKNASSGSMTFSSNAINLSSDQPSNSGGKGGGASADSPSDVAFFVRGTFGQGQQDSTSAANGYSSDTYSLAVGADKQIDSDLLLGTAFGYVRSKADVSGTTGTDSRSDTYLLSAYGSYQFQPNWYLEGNLSYGQVKMNMNRNTGFSQVSGDTKADMWGLSLGITTDVPLDETMTLRPFARLHHTTLAVEGYTEKGGAGGLVVKGHRIDSLASEIGLGVEQDFGDGWKGNASLAWEHDFNDRTGSIRTAFVLDPTNFTVLQGDKIKQDYGRLGLGVKREIDNERTLFINLDSVVGNSQYRDYTLELKFRQSF